MPFVALANISRQMIKFIVGLSSAVGGAVQGLQAPARHFHCKGYSCRTSFKTYCLE